MAPIPPAAAAAAAAQTCDAKAMSAKWTELNELAAAAKKREKKIAQSCSHSGANLLERSATKFGFLDHNYFSFFSDRWRRR